MESEEMEIHLTTMVERAVRTTMETIQVPHRRRVILPAHGYSVPRCEVFRGVCFRAKGI